jgi:hypothetical protein
MGSFTSSELAMIDRPGSVDDKVRELTGNEIW